jgi:hypothetical protein
MNNFEEVQLSIDAARSIRELHEAVRQAIEQHLEGAWRVTKIEEQSSTEYAPTLVTRTAPTPEYILSHALATFDIVAIENKPVDRRVEGQSLPLRVPLSELYCRAQVTSDGKLYIMRETRPQVRHIRDYLKG